MSMNKDIRGDEKARGGKKTFRKQMMGKEKRRNSETGR